MGGGQFWGKPGQAIQVRHREMPRIELGVKIKENWLNINSEYLVIIPVFFVENIVLFIVKSRDLCSWLINQWLFIVYLLLFKCSIVTIKILRKVIEISRKNKATNTMIIYL
jgi:hypothetical protein